MTLSAADTSVVVNNTVPTAPTIRTNTLDVIATQEPPVAAWGNAGFKITNGATPTASTDFAIKSYVDAVAQGLSVKPSAQEATTGAETFTIVAGSVTVIAGTVVDGISPAVNDRIAILHAPAATGAGAGIGTAPTSEPANGIYVVTANVTNLTVSRATDMNTGTQVPGAFVFVEEGTENASAGYVVVGVGPFTIGTTAIQWTQFSGAGEILAGTGITKVGNTLSLTNPVTVALGGTGQATAANARGTSGIGAATAPTSGSGGVVSAVAEGIPTKVMAVIGDGATTSFVITHNLNTRDVVVMIYAAATPWAEIITDVSMTSVNTITVTFATAPSASQFNVVIIG